jgi:putative membrane protein
VAAFVESSSLRGRTFGIGGQAEGVGQASSTVEVRTMMGWYGGGMGLGAWLFMGGFWVLLLVGIVWLVVHLLPGGSRTSTPQSPSAQEILDARFARGEIDEQAYAAARSALAAARGQGR